MPDSVVPISPIPTKKVAKQPINNSSTNYEEFRKIAKKSVVPVATHHQPGTTQFIIERTKAGVNYLYLFSIWDLDNNGFITMREVQIGLQKAGIHIKKNRILHIAEKVTKRVPDFLTNREFAPFMLALSKDQLTTLNEWMQKIIQSLDFLETLPSDAPRNFSNNFEIDSSSSESDTESKPGKSNGFKIERTLSQRRSESMDVENHLAEHHKAQEILGSLKKNIISAAPVLIAIILWQTTFSVFYYSYNKMPYPRAFYYAAQSGLSVGFGALNENCYTGICSESGPKGKYAGGKMSENSRDFSKFMTILNVLLGSSVIGGALSYFTTIMLSRQSKWEDDVSVNNNQDLVEETQKTSCTSCCRSCCSLAIGNLRVLIMIVLCVFTGVIFSMVHEDSTFIGALYYSITTMSTGGLKSPDPWDMGSMWFTGWYVLIGVPIYAMALGVFAGVLVEHMEKGKLKAKLNERITANEFRVASNRKSGDDEVDYTEFLEMELLRCGKVDDTFLRHVKKAFTRYDISNNGKITLDEMIAGNVFHMFNTSSPDENVIDFLEFSKCIKVLNAMSGSKEDISEEQIEAIFKIANDGGTKNSVLTMQEFFTFVSDFGLTDHKTKINEIQKRKSSDVTETNGKKKKVNQIQESKSVTEGKINGNDEK